MKKAGWLLKWGVKLWKNEKNFHTLKNRVSLMDKVQTSCICKNHVNAG